MILPRLFGLEQLEGSTSSSLALSSVTSSLPTSSTSTPVSFAPIATTTVYKVIYVIAETALPTPAGEATPDGTGSPAAAPAPVGKTQSAASAIVSAQSDLAGYASGEAYSGLTFAQLSAIALSLFLTVLLVTVMTAFFLRQARKMQAFAEAGRGDLSELGLGGGGLKRKREEKKGLLGRAAAAFIATMWHRLPPAVAGFEYPAGRRRPYSSSFSPHRLSRISALFLLALSPLVRADDAPSTVTDKPAPLSDLPTLTSSATTSAETVPQACAGLRACQAVEAGVSRSESTASVASAFLATATVSQPWATSTTAMQQYKGDNDVVLLHTDSAIEYSCPGKDDSWSTESLTDSLTAKTATGAGCTMKFTFTGDSIQLYGATGKDAGVFGCSVDTSVMNYTDWWSGEGSSNTYQPYQGSCTMQGIGYDKHTVQLVNSPNEPKKVYFTGLHYTVNESQNTWESLSWTACCPEYTFPDGVATTVKPAATAAAGNSGTNIGGLDKQTFTFVLIAMAIVIILASLLVGSLCCKRRPATGKKTDPLVDALKDDDDDASKPLRKKHGSRRGKNDTDTSSSETSDTGTSGDSDGESTEDEKPRRRKRRR
ncbi:hypothetical protein JCM11641_001598 [Rhodosporidiobolus odoratus]